MHELTVTAHDGAVQRYRMGRVTIIGRHPDCDVVLTDPMSSRRHCRIEMAGEGYIVEDLSSANGTQLNDEPLKTRRPFRSGDVVQIGFTRLQFQTPGAPLTENKPALDPALSIVRLNEDMADHEVSFEHSLAAGGQAITEDEVSSSDLAQLKRVTQRLKLLVDMGQALGSTLVPRELLQNCMDKLFETFVQADRGFILLFGPDGQIPSTIAQAAGAEDGLAGRQGPLSVSKIRNPEVGKENEVSVSRTIVNRVRAGRQSVLVSDATSDAEYSPVMSMARLQIRSVLCAPLIVGKEDLGILYLDTKDAQHRFTRDDLNLINAVAGQAAVVIKNAELARQAAAEAATRENLQRFLSPHLVDRIIKKEMTFDLGGTLKHGTVFFSDIVGFTRMAEQMRPADVVTLLNRYFKVMQEIVFARGGTVDKFSGDQIMAFWGILVDTPKASVAAATAALEMQNAMFAFNRDLARVKDIVQPPEPLGHGVGLNTGEFVAGNIGSKRKIEFTVIGNAVNLAQRLESIAGRGQVFLGQGTYEEIESRALVFRMPDCPVKNVSMPIHVYSLRGIVPLNPTARSAATADAANKTSRLEPAVEDLLLSLPCSLATDSQGIVSGVVTKMEFTREKRARVHVLSDRPVPVGAQLQLTWALQEKPNLPPLKSVVQRGWLPESQAPSDSLAEPNTSLVDLQSGQGTLVLDVESVPEPILAFCPGKLISSDLTSQDQIVRA